MAGVPWSATRVRTFQDCRRKYFYRYHLAPRARRPDPPDEARLADRVKDLVGLEAWAGELVHHVLEQVLNRWRAGREFGETEALTLAGRLLSAQYRDSGAYWTAHPDAYRRRPTLLDLHYYGEGGLSRSRAAGLKEVVLTSLRSFLRSELAARIRRVGKGAWYPVDRNAAAHLDSGLLVLVKPDFAFEDGGRLHVVDWKTGRPDPFWEVVQVSCYALYAAEKWGFPLERIVPQVVHLYPELQVSPTEYTRESLRDVKLFIHDSHAELAAASGDEELPPVERFPCCEDADRCRWCPFRGLCEGASRAGASSLPQKAARPTFAGKAVGVG